MPSIVDETLQNLGIDEKQIKVYLAALELGKSSIQELSSKSGIKRTSIYNFLEEMKKNDLLLEIKNKNGTWLMPQDPKYLLQKAQTQVKQISAILPNLVNLFNQPSNKPKVTYFQGRRDLERAYDDLINAGETTYGFSDYEKMFKAVDNKFLWEIPVRRTEKKIPFYCIAKDDATGRMVKTKDKEHLRETKLVKNIQLDTEINIYGNKVMMLSFHSPFAGVIIQDRAISQSIKSIWKIMWDGLK
jgi:sugar-specific transcriptional regulator TrmB